MSNYPNLEFWRELFLGEKYSDAWNILYRNSDGYNKEHYGVFVTVLDGRTMVCTDDIDIKRINIEVNNYKITKVRSIG